MRVCVPTVTQVWDVRSRAVKYNSACLWMRDEHGVRARSVVVERIEKYDMI